MAGMNQFRKKRPLPPTMKKWSLRILAVMIAIVGLIVVVSGWSLTTYERSLTATIEEIRLFREVEHPGADAIDAQMKAEKISGETSYELPADYVFTVSVKEEQHDGLTVYDLNEDHDSVYEVFYLHGGAYTEEFTKEHWKFLDELADGMDAEIFAPDYELSPRAVPEEVLGQLVAYWKTFVEENRGHRMILMGDGAGAGLALRLAQEVAAQGLAMPTETILFSPWTDLSLENPEIDSYTENDPLLDVEEGRAYASWWAGDLELKDPMVSPLYGSMEGLGSTTIFCGNREILYPDAQKLADQMKAAGVPVRFITGKGMNHNYQLLPVPEADGAITEMARVIAGIAEDETE